MISFKKRRFIFITLKTTWSEIVFYHESYSRNVTTGKRVPLNFSEINAKSELQYVMQIHKN
jgi:hypothetical protein